MTDTLNHRLLRVVFDGEHDDELVEELAASADAQADAIKLVEVLAEMPGDGARDAETRLDQLLEAVAYAAAGHVIVAQAVVPTRGV
jgi:hypothetical protein